MGQFHNTYEQGFKLRSRLYCDLGKLQTNVVVLAAIAITMQFRHSKNHDVVV